MCIRDRDDIIKILFAENPGIVIQVKNKHKEEVKKIVEDAGIGYVKLVKPTEERHILVEKGDATYQFGIDLSLIHILYSDKLASTFSLRRSNA